MKRYQKLRLFVAGFGIAVIASWITAQVHAQQPIKPLNSKIRVCVAPDGAMRLAGPASCPTGQKPLDLKVPDYPNIDSDDDKSKKDDAKSCTQEKQRVDSLEARLRALEGSSQQGSLRSRVTAPFQVFGRDGRVIFVVAEDRSAAVYNASGVKVAQMGASKGGGYISARSSDSSVDIAMETGPAWGRMVITDGNTERLRLGKESGGQDAYSLAVFGKSGTFLAGIGQNKLSPGGAVAVETGTANGGAAWMLADQGKGAIRVVNQSSKVIAELTQGNQGGLLNIRGANDQIMVEAGVAQGGFGVVRVGPSAFKPGFGVLGLPGSYLAGSPEDAGLRGRTVFSWNARKRVYT